MTPTPPPVLTIRFVPKAILEGLQPALQRAVDLVTFGLEASRSAKLPPTLMPDSWLRVQPAANLAYDLETLRIEFPLWILGAALRDCIESISVPLSTARDLCALGSFVKQGVTKGEDLNDFLQRQGAEVEKFNRLGLPDKVDFLRRQYGPQIVPDEIEWISTINAARNCLVHRRGVVAPHDTNYQDVLLVRWTRPMVRIHGAREVRLVVPVAPVTPGDRAEVIWTEAEKVFKIGDSIQFSAQEFSEICGTLLQFGFKFRDRVVDFLKLCGVKLLPADLAGEKEQPRSTNSDGPGGI